MSYGDYRMGVELPVAMAMAGGQQRPEQYLLVFDARLVYQLSRERHGVGEEKIEGRDFNDNETQTITLLRAGFLTALADQLPGGQLATANDMRTVDFAEDRESVAVVRYTLATQESQGRAELVRRVDDC